MFFDPRIGLWGPEGSESSWGPLPPGHSARSERPRPHRCAADFNEWTETPCDRGFLLRCCPNPDNGDSPSAPAWRVRMHAPRFVEEGTLIDYRQPGDLLPRHLRGAFALVAAPSVVEVSAAVECRPT